MEAEPTPTNPVSKIVGAPKDPKGVNFTHFLAFPLWDNYSSKIKEVQDKFAAFVAEKYPQHVKDYRLQGHKCQHLTIAMLMLDDDAVLSCCSSIYIRSNMWINTVFPAGCPGG